MSEEKVEIVRGAIEAYGREGPRRGAALLRPRDRVDLYNRDYIEHATYRGHDGLRRYLGSLEAEFTDLRFEPVDLIDAGEQVISSVRFTGRGKASGAPVELTLISVSSLRDGRIYCCLQLPSTWPVPSKPPDLRSRRCRRRTSMSFERSSRR